MLLGLGRVLALQRHLLVGLDLFALDLARVDFGANLNRKYTHTKAHSNIFKSVDLALETCGIALSSIDLPYPAADSYSDLVSEQSSPLRDPHSYNFSHADLNRDRNGIRVSTDCELVLSRCTLKDGVGA